MIYILTWGSGGALGVHPRGSHNLDHLKPEGGDVVLDLVDIVLRDALVLRLPLLLGDVSPHQVSDDRLKDILNQFLTTNSSAQPDI